MPPTLGNRLGARRGRQLTAIGVIAGCIAFGGLLALGAGAATPRRTGGTRTRGRAQQLAVGAGGHAVPTAVALRLRGLAPAALRDMRWTSTSPARGVELLNGTFRGPRVHLHWTVTIEAPTRSPLNGSPEYNEVGDAAWARTTQAALSAKGFLARATTLPWPRYLEDPRGVMGERIRVGQYETQSAAARGASALIAAGFQALVQWEGVDPGRTPDAELVHAVIVDPRRFRGHVLASHGPAVASRETVAAQAQRLGALAAVNGGFFTIASALTGVAGVPTGLGVYGGRLQGLSNGARADLVLAGRGPARIENLRASAQLYAAGGVARILGINRQPGSAEDCGVVGFSPTSAPRQGVTCTGASDLVLFTPHFGAALPAGPGLQATTDASGRVLTLGARGGPLRAGDSALQATGAEADWLGAHVSLGGRVRVSEHLHQASGALAALDRQTSIVSAAPILVRGGRTAIDAVQEGVFDPRDLYDYGFSAERHARTLAGIDRDGRLLLVTVDGVPGISEGFSLTEAADLMRTLGAVDAMNLDGGGSTSFVVGAQTINTPSDSTGARPVGDTVQVVP